MTLNALIFNFGQDSAGIGARYASAAARGHGRFRIRSIHKTDTYIEYPFDIRTDALGTGVRKLYRDADVVHLNHTSYGYDHFDRGDEKPILLEHHGTILRTNPARVLRQARQYDFEQGASTMDLVAIDPESITWLPAPYDLDELAAIRARHRRADDGIVRIVHAPTRRQIKSTDALIAAVERLRAEGLPVELDLIEHVSWAECLERKAAGDIYFDQVILGYGCNAIEAWGMGMPVVAGVDPRRAPRLGHPIPSTTRALMRKEFGALPFYEASEPKITDALRELVKSADLRAEWAAKGRAHAERFHAERPALERLGDLYMRAMARRGHEAVA